MRKLQKGGSSSGLLGWAARTNYILFERDTSRDGTGPKMFCTENKEKLPKTKPSDQHREIKIGKHRFFQDYHNEGRCRLIPLA